VTFISITRLRVRAVRFLPGFALLTLRSQRQVQASEGFRGGSLLADRRWTFWTMTAWDSEDHMRAYMTTGAHRTAMPRLVDWCDEASVVHWVQAEEALPSWPAADARMRRDGRASKVRHPSAHHASMTFDAPRVGTAGALSPRPKRR
jgi:heme-degrading monooxygenase HmoA